SAVGRGLAYIGVCLLGAALGILGLALVCATLFAFLYGAYWSVVFGASLYGVIGGFGGLVAYVVGVILTCVFCNAFCDSVRDDR
ncbi:hypothetical protein AAVH_29394, partial [Aphelenchoides avenae]